MKQFLKWVGGKVNVFDEIEKRLPFEIKETKVIKRYVEPFLGAGSVFFNLYERYNIKEAYLSDNSVNLIMVYEVIRDDVDLLIGTLKQMMIEYKKLSIEKRSEMYYSIRDDYNEKRDAITKEYKVYHSASTILLNRLCFNGLFRFNKDGEYNASFGYKDIDKIPYIFEEDNLIEISKVLNERNIHIQCCDYSSNFEHVNKNTFVFLDPPYRPVNKRGYFMYDKTLFTDTDQRRLRSFCEREGMYLFCNSDTKDDFFEELYKGWKIDKIKVKRHINCDGEGRGDVGEIMVMNYDNVENRKIDEEWFF